MLRVSKLYLITGVAAFAAIGGAALAQDKYSLRIPDGIAFSEFRGYESWQLVSLSHSDETLNVIVANPVMIKVYQAGVSGKGKPWPDGAKMVKIQYIPKKSTEAPFNVSVPGTLKDVAFMAKDAKRFSDSGGWGYALFNYNVKSRTFAAEGKGHNCGFACHTAVKAKDYVFTEYGQR